MGASTLDLRRPGLRVVVSGFIGAALTWWLVGRTDDGGLHLIGLYLGGVPIGAILIGVGSGLGFALSSRALQIKLSRGFVVLVALAALATYVAVLGSSYLELTGAFHIDRNEYSFTAYLRDTCEGMRLLERYGDQNGKLLGRRGYFYKLMEVSGLLLGAVVPSLIVRGKGYCPHCQVYLRRHSEGYANTPQSWLDIKRSYPKNFDAGLQQAIVELAELPPEVRARLMHGTVTEVATFIASLDSKPRWNSAAHLIYLLEKCPYCESHRIKVTLGYQDGNGEKTNRTYEMIDKLRPHDYA